LFEVDLHIFVNYLSLMVFTYGMKTV